MNDVEQERPARCVYCDAPLTDPDKDKDHIPGKQFFAKPRPADPPQIEVPSCRNCQQEFQPYENYMRSIITFGPAGITTEGQRIWAQTLDRLYTMNRDPGLKKLIARSFSSAEVVTPDGLYLGNTMLVNTDWKRVRHFVTKLVRGLYFFEFGTSLPTATFISIPECHAEHLDLSEPHSLTRRGKRTWPGTFEYKCNRVEDHPEQSAWMFRFLNTNVFLAFTGTQQEEKPGRTSKTNVQ